MIRPLTADDADAFIELRRLALRQYPTAFGGSNEDEHDRDLTRANIARKHAEDFILGYFENGLLLGTLGFIRGAQSKKRHKAIIWGMFVHPDCQGRGVGRALLEEALRRARGMEGLESVHLSVTQTAHSAFALYRSLGFEAWGTEKRSLLVDGSYIDEVYMRLDL